MQKDACPRCGHSEGKDQLIIVPFTLTAVASHASAMVRTVVQVPLKPVRLVVDPLDAADFTINDIQVGRNSQFAAVGQVGASIFPPNPHNQNPINNLAGIDKVQAGMEISLHITNINNASRNFSAVIYALADYDM